MSRIVLSEEQRKAFSDLFNVNSRFMRTVMGVVNNAAWMTCLDAIDQIRKHPRYRQNIKGSTTPMRQFKRCFDMLKDYEKRLKYGQKFPFFHVGNFTKETRDTFADNFTDNDYYDLWAASGFTVYSENRAMVTSLQNKLRLAYLNHGDPQPDIMGWAAASQCALDIAAGCWLSGIFSCDTTEEQYRQYHLPIPNNYWRKFYKDFNLAEIADFWADCIRDLAPDSPVRLDDIRYTCWPEQETKIEVKTLTEPGAEEYQDRIRPAGAGMDPRGRALWLAYHDCQGVCRGVPHQRRDEEGRAILCRHEGVVGKREAKP